MIDLNPTKSIITLTMDCTLQCPEIITMNKKCKTQLHAVYKRHTLNIKTKIGGNLPAMEKDTPRKQ